MIFKTHHLIIFFLAGISFSEEKNYIYIRFGIGIGIGLFIGRGLFQTETGNNIFFFLEKWNIFLVCDFSRENEFAVCT